MIKAGAGRGVRIPSLRQLAAHHEAGHYVVACAVRMGHTVSSASLRPRGDLLGCVRLRLLIDPDGVRRGLGGRSWRRSRGNPIIIDGLGCLYACVAGLAAEAILFGSGLFPLECLVEEMYLGPERGETRVALQYFAALEGRECPRRPGREFLPFLREFGRVTRWMRGHWRHVRAVARALAREGRLTRARLDGLMARLPPIDDGELLLPRGWMTPAEYGRFQERSQASPSR